MADKAKTVTLTVSVPVELQERIAGILRGRGVPAELTAVDDTDLIQAHMAQYLGDLIRGEMQQEGEREAHKSRERARQLADETLQGIKGGPA